MRLLVLFVALGVGATAALPPVAEARRFVEVSSQANSTLLGPVFERPAYYNRFFGPRTGQSVAAAGDVNGDGRPDLIVGVPGYLAPGPVASGAAFVVLDAPPRGKVQLTRLGNRGFAIYGPDDESDDGAGTGGTVDTAGDFNGDGLDDLLVTAPGKSSDTGSAYVVFGTRTPRDVRLASLGADGLTIDGVSPKDPDDGTCDSGCELFPGSRVGSEAAPAGDVNGDGFDDVIVAAWPQSEAVVVFGRTAGGRVGFHSPEGGFLIDRLAAYARAELDFLSVAGAGDVNGDGRADVLVGADASWGGNCIHCNGNAYLVFGKDSADTVHVDRLGARGLRIIGPQRSRAGFGYDVAGPGDVNGDGRPDLLIGSSGRGAAVIFGSAATGSVRIDRLRGRGFLIGPRLVADVDGVGDWNGDGLRDLAVVNHVVFGKRSARSVSLDRGFRGFTVINRDHCPRRLEGCPDREFGERTYRLTAAGDLDGNGRPDILFGDAGTAPLDNGAAYVLLNAGSPRAAVVKPRDRKPVEVGSEGQLELPVLCPANAVRACTGVVRVMARNSAEPLLSERFRMRAGRYALVRGRLPSGINKRLRRRRGLEVIARVRARDPRGRRGATATDLVLIPAT